MNAKLIVIFVAATFVSTVNAGDHKWMCQGEEIKLSDESKEAFKTCWNELKERKGGKGGDDEKQHFKPDACFIACKLERTKAVVDGKLQMDKIKEWVDASFPSSVREDLKTHFQSCADDVKETLSTDDDCKSYKKLGMCQMKAIKKTCKNKNDDDA